ncbi:MAG: DUF4085 family protein [Tissierellia bacterium]|nr:DUF4085 family protein [Tissierellia bacterium]
MKYFTKEYAESLQYTGLVDKYEAIENDLRDSDIEDLYKKMEGEFIEEERRAYDTPPVEIYGIFGDLELALKDVLIGDVDKKGYEYDLRNPESLEEWNKYKEESFKRDMEEFENRGPFDEEEARELFKINYNMALEAKYHFPDWVYESVDNRLIALYYLPRDVYDKLKKISDENEEFVRKVDRLADENLYSQAIPDHMHDLLLLHDANLIKLEEREGDIFLYIRSECYLHTKDPIILKFVGGEYLEKEEMNLEVDSRGYSSTSFSYQETHNKGDHFEFHFLLNTFVDGGVKDIYLTIKARDLVEG